MKNFDLYNPIHHKGYLPVRVLSNNFLEWFENVTPTFKEEYKDEIDFHGLNNKIIYHINKLPINECACINNLKQIELYENYNQYLWCICYSLLVLFDEGIQKPLLLGNFNGKINFKNPFILRATDVFNNGFDLLHTYRDWIFFQIPNPEKYNEFEKFYIEKTNAIYTSAMVFILLHEFAHQYYGHADYSPTSDQSKKDELIADDYAIDKIKYNLSNERGYTYKFGAIAAISSLIMLNKSLSGGSTHPDVDERLKIALDKIQLDEKDNIWGVASLTLILWCMKYNHFINIPKVVVTYKELFDLTANEIIHYKY